jgi:stage II sporulation protein D
MTPRWSVASLALATVLSAHAAVTDAGARDVSVAMFTTRDVSSVLITPAAPGAWTAACATCTHKPLTSPLTISSGEVYAGGTLRVGETSDTKSAVTAAGLWHLRGYAHGIDVVLTLPSERYTAAVVSAEAAANEPAESLRALAIVARTYALNGAHYHAGAGHLPAQLCDSTQCQVLRLSQIPTAVNDAVRDTAGETLWFGNTRAEVFFSQHCGGQTADVNEAWTSGSKRPVPYLKSHADTYCLRKGPAAWHTSISLDEMKTVAQREGWHVPPRIVSVSITQRSVSGRAAKLSVRGAAGETNTLSATALRFAVGRALGWNRIRSDLYDVALRNNALVFDGRGHGHGVGLCQAGATEMAIEHHDARSILAFYFPGTHIRITANDEGWIETRVGNVTVRSNTALSNDTRDQLTLAWQNAKNSFPSAKSPETLVIFSPSTELYRQMTGQPGWNLASTRGSVVTLQPATVMRRPGLNGGSQVSIMEHEFLHVLIEGEATERAPVWLREGLAEALVAGGFTASIPTQSNQEIDTMLQHADSWGAANAAHIIAGVCVKVLIDHYGLSTVRGWLKSGVPASVAAGK